MEDKIVNGHPTSRTRVHLILYRPWERFPIYNGLPGRVRLAK
jgi:hypothetical protein